MGKQKRADLLLPVLAGALTGALVARFLLPGETPPVRKKLPTGSRAIAELKKLRIGGADQWVLIRSEDVVNNPVLLILHGGPGTSVLSMSREHTQALEKHFTIVNWDQRGAGKSWRAGRDAQRMTIDQMIDDTRELTDYLRQRFSKEKIFLQGRSWGSALGMLTVVRHEALFYAYIGIGQISDMVESEKMSYNWTMDQSVWQEDRAARRELEKMGPPPYAGDWLKKFNTQRKYVAKFGGEVHRNPMGGNLKIARSLIFSEEYTFTERLVYNNAVQRSLRLLHPQLMKVNLFESAKKVTVPVFIASGRYDQVVPSELSARYFEALDAPSKELVWFERSAHMPDVEEKEAFHRMLIEKVLPLAQKQ